MAPSTSDNLHLHSGGLERCVALLPKVTCATKSKDLRPLEITEIIGRVAAGLVQSEL